MMDIFGLSEFTPEYSGEKTINVRIHYTLEDGRRVSQDMRLTDGDIIDGCNFGNPKSAVTVTQL